MEFKEVFLGELVGFRKGYVFKSKDFSNSGVHVVKITNFREDTVDLNSCEKLPIEFFEEYIKYSLNTNDILIATVGSWQTNPNSVVGRVVRVPKLKNKALLNQNTAKIYSITEELDNDFLYYILKSKEFKDYIVSTAQGSANQASITLDAIRSFKCNLPSIEIQKNIAKLLNLFDEKITNNSSVVRNLEGLGEDVFKRWFIDFEFPNEQGLAYRSSGGEMVESELGEIPKGWQVGSIDDICILKNEKVNLDKYEETFNYIGLEHMPQGSIALNDWESSEKVSGTKSVFNRGDILFGKLRPYFKKVGIAATNGVCSTDILVMLPKNMYEYSFLISHLTQDKFIEYTTSTATGTRMPRSGWNQISNYAIVIPPIELLENYNEKILPMLQMIQELVHENNSLKSLRDSLLPKLLSGEIEIPNESVVEL